MRSDTLLSSKYYLKDDKTGEPTDGIDYRYTSWQNMSKYENSIERTLYRALHELERIQRSRIAAEINNPQDQEAADQTIFETPDPQTQTSNRPPSPSPSPKKQPQPASQSPAPKTRVPFYETNPISVAACAASRSQNERLFPRPPLENQKAAS
jgi:hypothetical protein